MILTPQRMLIDLRFATCDNQDTSSFPATYEIRKLDEAQDELCDELLLADPLILADYYDLTLTGAARYYLPTYIPQFNFESILMITDVTDSATSPGKTVATAWRDRVNIVDTSIIPEYEPWSIIDNNIEFPECPSSGTMRIWYTHRPVGLFYGTSAAGAATSVTFPSTATEGDVITEDDYYNGMKVYVGGQVRRITDYVGSTRVATITPAWSSNPTDATTVELISPLPDRYHKQIVLRAIRSIKNHIDDDDTSILREINMGTDIMKSRIGKREKQGPEFIRQVER